MGRQCKCLREILVPSILILSACLSEGASTGSRLDPATPSRGVAFLSSNIGEDVSPDEIYAFVRTCCINLVVIDFAWITYHWPRTSLEVGDVIEKLEKAGVEIAVMYRPRALNRSDADVHYAVNEDGTIPADHNDLCFAHDDSAAWGAQWGSRILKTFPSVDRVILYNLRAPCRCEKCRNGQGRRHAARFLQRCRAEWKEIRSGIQIGHVGIGTEYADQVDFLCPFLSVNREGDSPLDAPGVVGEIAALRRESGGKPIVPLVKTCWALSTNNTTEDVAHVIRRCEQAKTNYILWYYSWLFHSTQKRYDPKTLLMALGGDWERMSGYFSVPEKTPDTGAAASRNSPTSWVYFESKESREGQPPRLALAVDASTKVIPVLQDSALLSYLPTELQGHQPWLSVNMSDENRVLLAFALAGIAGGESLKKAELLLDMKNSESPVVEPFELAVHAVMGEWREQTVHWENQPAFSPKPSLTVPIEPKPGIVRLDMTDMVRAWLLGDASNYGLLLKVASPLPKPSPHPPPGDNLYTPEQIQSTDAMLFFQRIGDPEPGYQGLAALRALDEKARMGDAATRRKVANRAMEIIRDRSETSYRRWNCCYILSATGDERGIAVLGRVLAEETDETLKSVAACALGQYTTDAAQKALEQAAKQPHSAQVRESIEKALAGEFRKSEGDRESARTPVPRDPTAQAGNRMYSGERIRERSADFFFERLGDTEPGYHRFAALQALAEKHKNGDAATKEQIVTRAIEILEDRSRSPLQRWQCCYVLSGTGDERGIPVLARVLLEDGNEIVRDVAACALGRYTAEAARKALEQAAKLERSERVKASIKKALAGGFQRTDTTTPSSGGSTTDVPDLPFPRPETHVEKLPWPHQPPGLDDNAVDKINREVWVINDFPLYQADERGTWRYFHGGFDIVLENGAKIYAMKDGWVKAIHHSTAVIADAEGDAPSYGWEYTHLGNFQVRVGDFVKRGARIGDVSFQGLPHIHLGKVFSQEPHWGTWQYLCAPNAHFTYVDKDPPVIKKPFYFFQNNSDAVFQPDAAGNVTVRGNVDIVVGMREAGLYARSNESGFGDRLGVARIEYAISPVSKPRKPKHEFNSFDFTKLKIKSGYDAREYSTRLTRVVYKHWTLFETSRPHGSQTFSYYIVTNCPGQGPSEELKFEDGNCCWNTAALDKEGKRVFPDGDHEISVTAHDFAGNKSTAVMRVFVNNGNSPSQGF